MDQNVVSDNKCGERSEIGLTTDSWLDVTKQTNRVLSNSDKHSDYNFCDSSLQLLDDYRMDTCLTPSLQMKINCGPKDNDMDMDCIDINNSLGLSPVKAVKTGHHNPIESHQSSDQSFSLSSLNFSQSSNVLKGIQINNFSAKEQQLGTDSLIFDDSFKSVSKCSDFELREEPKVDVNDTFRSPNSNFENKSIESYFRQQSEPINSFKSLNDSIVHPKQEIDSQISKSNFSLIDDSFVSVCDEIDLANNTLEIAQKLIDRKNRKRKSSSSESSVLSTSSDKFSFAPSVNSTLNSCQGMSEKVVVVNEDNSSGFGTFSGLTHQTYAIPDSRSIGTLHSLNANSLNLNQLLFISPNVLSLSIGCFVGFKLNYLKIKNMCVTSFVAEIKVKANIDTLNSLDIEYPKQPISIPSFFDGLLSDKIVLTPLKSGSFQVIFQVYPKIENINLPISPMSVICNIKVEELIVKRPFYSSNCSLIEYNLFEDNRERQTINLLIPNKNITNEIPLRLSLEPNSVFAFDPIYRHPDSAIHSFRCLDANTMFLTTKTQYEMRIPIRVEANNQLKSESCLTVSIDSNKSHVLAIIRLRATFWPKKPLTKPLLQCSESTIILSDKWKAIHFRNKSEHNLIGVTLKCVRNKASVDHLIKLSTHKLMLRPQEKISVGILAQQRAVNNLNGIHLSVAYDSGLGKSFSLTIPIEIH